MRLTFSTLSRVLILIAFAICNVRAQEVVSRIDGYMNAAAQSGTFSGAILIAREGKVLINKGYGMASLELGVANTPEMKYRIGSLTKQFTAMAVLILQEHGRLNVQDSVCKYVSECPPDWAAITIHHLLTHTSGIPELLSLPEFQTTLALPSPVSRTVERFRNKPLEFRPGEKFKYSNSGYILLAYIIERITGQPYEDFLKDNIFEPLKMMNTGSDHNERIIKNRAAGYSKKGNEVVNAAYIDMSIPTGGGSLYSTTGDLFLWDQALYANKLITKKSSEIMFASYTKADWGDGVAYGWFTGKDKWNHQYMGFLGGINGFAAQIMRYPNEKVLVVVLSNYSFAPLTETGNDLAAIIFGNKLY